jgi:hypothetical protein
MGQNISRPHSSTVNNRSERIRNNRSASDEVSRTASQVVAQFQDAQKGGTSKIAKDHEVFGLAMDSSVELSELRESDCATENCRVARRFFEPFSRLTTSVESWSGVIWNDLGSRATVQAKVVMTAEEYL